MLRSPISQTLGNAKVDSSRAVVCYQPRRSDVARHATVFPEDVSVLTRIGPRLLKAFPPEIP